VSEIPQNTRDSFFYRAVLAINEENFAEAFECISAARAILDVALTALITEGYDRAFKKVVQVQILTELEEVIRFVTLCLYLFEYFFCVYVCFFSNNSSSPPPPPPPPPSPPPPIEGTSKILISGLRFAARGRSGCSGAGATSRCGTTF
jgi:hypothetical protein